MAKNRQIAINADHLLVEEFFETVEYLKEKAGSAAEQMIDHCRSSNQMGINLKEFETQCRYFGIRIPPIIELKSVLKGAKRYPFLGINPVNSCITHRTKKCWVFDTSKST